MPALVPRKRAVPDPQASLSPCVGGALATGPSRSPDGGFLGCPPKERFAEELPLRDVVDLVLEGRGPEAQDEAMPPPF